MSRRRRSNDNARTVNSRETLKQANAGRPSRSLATISDPQHSVHPHHLQFGENSLSPSRRESEFDKRSTEKAAIHGEDGVRWAV
jgi:hypothetical protein